MSTTFERLLVDDRLHQYSNFSETDDVLRDGGPNNVTPDLVVNDTFTPLDPSVSVSIPTWSVQNSRKTYNNSLEYIYFHENSARNSTSDHGYFEYNNTNNNLDSLLEVDTTITFWYYNENNDTSDALTVCSWYEDTNSVETNIQILYTDGNSGSNRQAFVKYSFSVGNSEQVTLISNSFDVRISEVPVWTFIAITICPNTHKIFINSSEATYSEETRTNEDISLCQYFFKQSNAVFRIGSHADSNKENTEIFKGRLGNFSIFKKQLNQFELFSLNDLDQRLLEGAPYVGNNLMITNYRSLYDVTGVPSYSDVLGTMPNNYVNEIVLLNLSSASSVGSVTYLAPAIDSDENLTHEILFDSGALVSSGEVELPMVVAGSPTFQTIDGIPGITLSLGQCFYFANGTNAFNSLFNNDFTMTFTFRTNASTENERLFIAVDPDGFGVDLQLSTSGVLSMRQNSNTTIDLGTNLNLRDNNWHRVFVTSEAKLRVDNSSSNIGPFDETYSPKSDYVGFGFGIIGNTFSSNFIWYYFRTDPSTNNIDQTDYGNENSNSYDIGSVNGSVGTETVSNINCITFGNTSKYLRLKNDLLDYFKDKTNGITFTFWVYLITDNSNDSPLFSATHDHTSNSRSSNLFPRIHIALQRRGSGEYRFRLYVSNGAEQLIVVFNHHCFFSGRSNEWVQLTCRFTSKNDSTTNNVDFFVNGSKIDSQENSDAFIDSTLYPFLYFVNPIQFQAVIGGRIDFPDRTNSPLNQTCVYPMASFQMFSRVLSDSEILEIYNDYPVARVPPRIPSYVGSIGTISFFNTVLSEIEMDSILSGNGGIIPDPVGLVGDPGGFDTILLDGTSYIVVDNWDINGFNFTTIDHIDVENIWTICLWFSAPLSENVSGQRLFSSIADDSIENGHNAFEIRYGSDQTISTRQIVNNSNRHTVFSTQTYNDENFHLLILDSKKRFSIDNGAEEWFLDNNHEFFGTKLYFGGVPYSADLNFEGKLGPIMFFDKLLTFEERKAIFLQQPQLHTDSQGVVFESTNKIDVLGFVEGGSKTIVLPSSTQRIRPGAFLGYQNPTGPESIDTNSALNLIEIGESSFFDANSLMSFDIPNNLLHIEQRTFEKTSLTQAVIPSTVTSIEKGAFNNISTLENVRISDPSNSSLASVAEFAFDNLTSVTEENYSAFISDLHAVYLNNNSVNLTIEIEQTHSYHTHSVFNELVSQSDISFPNDLGIGDVNGVIYDGNSVVDIVTDYVFANNIITIENGITTIVSNVFFEKTFSANSIQLPSSMTTFEEYAFHGFTALVNLNIPSSVSSIGESCFLNCINLENIVLSPDSSLQNLGQTNMFLGTNLTEESFSNLLVSLQTLVS